MLASQNLHNFQIRVLWTIFWTETRQDNNAFIRYFNNFRYLRIFP